MGVSVSVKNKMNAAGAAPMFALRAWVNFDGTGAVAIRAGGNVSSITDNAVGDYTMNFVVNMPDENYSALPIGGDANVDMADITRFVSATVSAYRFRVQLANSTTETDSPNCSVGIVR